MSDQPHSITPCCFCGTCDFSDADPAYLRLETASGLTTSWPCHTCCFEKRLPNMPPAPHTDQLEPESPSETWRPGMEYFRVEFRRPGELITSVTTFGLDEDDALEGALAIFDDFPEGDPRSYGDPLEVRIGTVAQEVTFSTGWRKLQS